MSNIKILQLLKRKYNLFIFIFRLKFISRIKIEFYAFFFHKNLYFFSKKIF